MPLHSHCPYVVACFPPNAVNNGHFCATTEAAWSRWSQGQSPTWRAVLVLSNYLGEKKRLLRCQPALRHSGQSDNTLAWYNVAALIVWTQRWKAQEICRRFSLSTKQCSGQAGLEKCKMWRHPGSSWCADPWAERLKCKAITYNPCLSDFLRGVSCFCLPKPPSHAKWVQCPVAVLNQKRPNQQPPNHTS